MYRRELLWGGRGRRAAVSCGHLLEYGGAASCERVLGMPSWLSVRDRQHCRERLRCWDDHGDDGPERVCCVRSGDVSVGQRFDRLH